MSLTGQSAGAVADLKLESDLLRTFLVVAETGSMSAAAERIFRSQSATSLQMKRLEELVGQSLFDRHGRGVTLTDIGEHLRDAAREIVARLDETLISLQPGHVAGRLRIGIPDEYGRTILPHALAAFARQHPRIEVTARCALSAEFPTAIDRGELDIAVYDTNAPSKDETVLVEQRLLWVVSRSRPPRFEPAVPVVVYDKSCWWREAALGALQQSAIPYRIAYTSESASGVEAVIEAGLAVGIVSEDRLRSDFMTVDDFPAAPRSCLVLAEAAHVDARLARPMRDAILAAFRASR